jgi:hypothetical protein
VISGSFTTTPSSICGSASMATATHGTPGSRSFDDFGDRVKHVDFNDASARLPQADDGGPVGNAHHYIGFENLAEGDLLALHYPDDPAHELEYTTFGIWDLARNSVDSHIGGAAWGAITPVADMPTSASATYTGGLLGTRIAADGEVSHYEATSFLTALFDFDQVTLYSLNTRDLETGADTGGLDLFVRAVGSIVDNTFTSPANAIGLNGDGMAEGQYNGAFYGPHGEEAAAGSA